MKRWIALWALLAPGLSGLLAQRVDYRYYQAGQPEHDAGLGPAVAITSMMANCLGAPACLSAKDLAAKVPAPGGLPSPYLYQYAEFLQAEGIPHCANAGEVGEVQRGQLFKATAGGVQHWAASQAKTPATVLKLLARGQKAVTVHYHAPAWLWDKLKPGKGAHLGLEDVAEVLVEGKVLPYKKAKKKYFDLHARTVQAAPEGKAVVRLPARDSAAMTHVAMNVVGHDPDGFWLHGCRGADWGDGGFVHISYGLHQLICQEVMAVLMVEVQARTLPPPMHRHDFRLRTLPEKLDGAPHLQLFVVDAGQMPASPVTHLSYSVMPEGASADSAQVLKALVNAISAGSGFPVIAPCAAEGAYEVVLKYRCANGELGERRFRGVRWVNGEWE